MLEHIMIHKVCLRCGRKLKNSESRKLGFGKTCWEKFNSEQNLKKLFEVSENANK